MYFTTWRGSRGKRPSRTCNPSSSSLFFSGLSLIWRLLFVSIHALRGIGRYRGYSVNHCGSDRYPAKVTGEWQRCRSGLPSARISERRASSQPYQIGHSTHGSSTVYEVILMIFPALKS